MVKTFIWRWRCSQRLALPKPSSSSPAGASGSHSRERRVRLNPGNVARLPYRTGSGDAVAFLDTAPESHA
jgi:hypothetical protein